ncbi:MAG: Mut7-C RNAse domain-containing protein [Chloroflexi bacterium]|nr:Mut7-C RNAse domain-containing protein [Chloroflexota bacterium]
MSTEPSFLVDINVGRLAKWLRALGYDALLARDPSDTALVRLAQQEHRILVTRDRRLMQRRAISRGRLHAVLVHSDEVRQQLEEVVQALDLGLASSFTRCIACNLPLRPVPREAVADRVPPYVHQTQPSFMECPLCQNLYWRGTHWRNMLLELAQVPSLKATVAIHLGNTEQGKSQ